MYAQLSHFAIYIDDPERAKSFYQSVFDWGFQSYGQEDFLQIKSNDQPDAPLIGAIQSRKYSPIPEKVLGYECTIAVADLDSTIEKVQENGGQVVLSKSAIPFVGWIAKFTDTEGNLFCAMQYDATVRPGQ